MLCECVLMVLQENIRGVPEGLILSLRGKSAQIFGRLLRWETLTLSSAASLDDARTGLSCTYSLPTSRSWKGWGGRSCSCWVTLPFLIEVRLWIKVIDWTERNWGRLSKNKGGCGGSGQKKESWAELLFCWSRIVFLHPSYKKYGFSSSPLDFNLSYLTRWI